MVARSKETHAKSGEHSPQPQPQPTPYQPPTGYQPPYPPYQPPAGYQPSSPPYQPPSGYQPPYVPSNYPTPNYPTPNYPDPTKPYHEIAQGHIETPTPEYLVGWIAADLIEYGGVKPTTIIQTDTDWAIRIYWSLYGVLAPLICGEWCVHAFLESMGPGPEFTLPNEENEIRIPLDPCGEGKYKYDFQVPRGTVTTEHCGTPYKLVVSLTYFDECNRPGPMAGFVELPMLQFYQPGQVKAPPQPQPQPFPPLP